MTDEQKKAESAAEELSGEVGKAVESLLEVGRLWASHGLRIGRSALETSARTLEVTASTLDGLANKLEPKKG